MQPKSKEQQQHMKQNTLCSKRRSMILHTNKGCGIIVILEASPSPAARARHQNAHCSLTHRVQLTEWQAGAALATVTIFQWFQSRHISSSKAVTNLSERGVRGREGGGGGRRVMLFIFFVGCIDQCIEFGQCTCVINASDFKQY